MFFLGERYFSDKQKRPLSLAVLEFALASILYHWLWHLKLVVNACAQWKVQVAVFIAKVMMSSLGGYRHKHSLLGTFCLFLCLY